MTQADYEQLIKRYAAGELNLGSTEAAINELLAQSPMLQPTDLLTSTQAMLKAGEISPSDFRKISELITELNIRLAVSPSDKAKESDGEAIDETLIMRSPPSDQSDDETLIIPTPQRAHAAQYKPSYPAPRQAASKRPSELNVDIKEGDILKDRFELIELLGYGGMGVVYKARDLVRVKAQDSNPYVAIKVLSEAFKKHSRAFIALQREASKSQRLAHPNIATVYDFDHDGKTIYMTMELLDGQPFDALINQLPPGGLPKEVALRYVEDLCHGLSYAHKQHLIHCDLKPANIYLCNNGTVKLLDFGITRAIKDERQGKDETLFDPATLKALTPAYASVEMFRGDPPDPRDDIYALACVSYELLTGSHPYKKVAAHKALELDLKPAPIKGLSRTQQHALSKALVLERSKRTPTVEAFMQGMRTPRSRAKQLAIAGAVLLSICAALLVKPVQTHLREEAKLAMVQDIQSGNRNKLLTLLDDIHQLDNETKEYYTFRLRKEIIAYYEERINTVKNADQQRYDYPEAMRLLDQVKRLYTDSAILKEAEMKLLEGRNNLVSILVNNYEKLNAQNKDTRRILEILKEADPEHPLLRGD